MSSCWIGMGKVSCSLVYIPETFPRAHQVLYVNFIHIAFCSDLFPINKESQISLGGDIIRTWAILLGRVWVDSPLCTMIAYNSWKIYWCVKWIVSLYNTNNWKLTHWPCFLDSDVWGSTISELDDVKIWTRMNYRAKNWNTKTQITTGAQNLILGKLSSWGWKIQPTKMMIFNWVLKTITKISRLWLRN